MQSVKGHVTGGETASAAEAMQETDSCVLVGCTFVLLTMAAKYWGRILGVVLPIPLVSIAASLSEALPNTMKHMILSKTTTQLKFRF